jgi:hypothetical protein
VLIEDAEAIASRMSRAASDYTSISERARAHLNDYELLQRQIVPYEKLPPVQEWGQGPALTKLMANCQTTIKTTWKEFLDWKTQTDTFLGVAFGGSGNTVLQRFDRAMRGWTSDTPQEAIDAVEDYLGRGISLLRSVRQELEFFAPPKPAPPPPFDPARPSLLKRISAHPVLSLAVSLAIILTAVVSVLLYFKS